jgi:integrase/recombinase XerD
MTPVVTLAVALDRYEDQYLASRNLAPLTRRTYLDDLRRLAASLAEHEGANEPGLVMPGHLERYLAALDVRGLAGATRRQLAAFTSFFRFLQHQGLVPVNPAQDLVPPRREQEPPRVLSEKEYKRLQEAVQFHVRDAAMIELLLQTGLRLSELAALTLPTCICRPRSARTRPAPAVSPCAARAARAAS